MTIASATIRRQCQDKSQCSNDAVWGLYQWKPWASDINVDKPVKVFCGRHKPRPGPIGNRLRLVRLKTEGES